MPRKAKTTSSKTGSKNAHKAQPAPAVEEALDAGDLADRVIERPDGFYWESKKKGQTFGPFPTLAEAEADMLSGGAPAEDLEAESLHEAESELGINEWIDPDTGGPAEDNVPHIEDH
jgi:hypothetical protein